MYLAPLNYDRFFKKIFSDERIAKQFLEDFFGFEIEEIELQPLEHKLTNEASLVSFDYRCKINGKFIIIDMQQWYKHDVVKRFYMYHTANTVIQLENLPLKAAGKERKTKDYGELLPVITLIWMVDDGLKFERDYTAFTMLPLELLNFVQDKPLWENKDCDPILEKRAAILEVINNDTKNLSFLRENQLIFAFQSYITKNAENKDKRYVRWFEFAEKTRDSENKKEDFAEFEADPVFAELIRRLNHKSLNQSDRDYMYYYDELLGVMEAKARDSREAGKAEGREEGRAEGRKEGRAEGRKEGRAEGKIEGKEEGEQIGIVKSNIETIASILKDFPNFSNEQMGKIVQLELNLIEEIRSVFQQDQLEEVKLLIPKLFENIAGLDEKSLDSLEEWMIDRWKSFHNE